MWTLLDAAATATAWTMLHAAVPMAFAGAPPAAVSTEQRSSCLPAAVRDYRALVARGEPAELWTVRLANGQLHELVYVGPTPVGGNAWILGQSFEFISRLSADTFSVWTDETD